MRFVPATITLLTLLAVPSISGAASSGNDLFLATGVEPWSPGYGPPMARFARWENGRVRVLTTMQYEVLGQKPRLLAGKRAYVHGRLIGEMNEQGVFVAGPGVALPQSIAGQYVLLTAAPMSPPAKWKLLAPTAERNEMLDKKTRDYIRKTSGETTAEKLGRTVYLSTTVFGSASGVVEFVSMTIEDSTDSVESPGHAISLAWGLGARDEPVVFRPLTDVGGDPYPHFYTLAHAMDLGADGSIDLVFSYEEGSDAEYEVWQSEGATFRRIGRARLRH